MNGSVHSKQSSNAGAGDSDTDEAMTAISSFSFASGHIFLCPTQPHPHAHTPRSAFLAFPYLAVPQTHPALLKADSTFGPAHRCSPVRAWRPPDRALGVHLTGSHKRQKTQMQEAAWHPPGRVL
eukprot:1141700-Pelagomonas_calceolata.AAC.3